MQFTKALRKGSVTNAYLYPNTTDLVGVLDRDERCVVRVDCRNGTVCFFTPSRLIIRNSTATQHLPYDSVIKCNWITRDEHPSDLAEESELKQQYFDRVYLHLSDGDAVELSELDQAYSHILTFFSWLLEKRETKSPTTS